MNNEPVIAVDFDGTLFKHIPHYDYGKHFDKIGTPIPVMINRVRRWLKEGRKVVIFTARMHSSHPIEHRRLVRKVIREKCMEVFGQPLPVTSEKHPDMVEIYDDRAIQVIPDTGKLVIQAVAQKALALKRKTSSVQF